MGEFIRTKTYNAERKESGDWKVTDPENPGKSKTVPHDEFMKDYTLAKQPKGQKYGPGKAAYVKALKEANAAAGLNNGGKRKK